MTSHTDTNYTFSLHRSVRMLCVFLHLARPPLAETSPVDSASQKLNTFIGDWGTLKTECVYPLKLSPSRDRRVLPTSPAPEMFGFCEALRVAVGPVHLHSFCGNRQDLWLPSFLHRPCSWTQHSWTPTSTLVTCSKRPGYSTGLWQPT